MLTLIMNATKRIGKLKTKERLPYKECGNTVPQEELRLLKESLRRIRRKRSVQMNLHRNGRPVFERPENTKQG